MLQAPTSAGYDVTVDVEDMTLPPDVDAATFRIVQEGITNALKHSNGHTIAVRVAESPHGTLEVSVRDDGRAEQPAVPRSGHGLDGIRERVDDLGGDLSVDADHDGWLLRATIPLKESA